jgi:hypothetical protein
MSQRAMTKMATKSWTRFVIEIVSGFLIIFGLGFMVGWLSHLI